ncbi:MAG: primosomal protein N' [Candidatus Gracilibacteria bacterium]|nr:primosomal protein N' [Candidatus Gracilibacteria bacterium]
MYAEILLQQKIGPNQETLTYKIPENLTVQTGHLVAISLRNRITSGLIWETHNQTPKFKTIEIKELINEQPILSKPQIDLIKWLSEYYFCPLHKVLKLFIPKKVFLGKPPKSRLKKEEQIIRSTPKELTKNQQEIFAEITKENNSLNKFLIHGITGSGKTEIYVRVANHYIKQNHQVLIMVPEISLTPQTIEYFEKALGIKAAIIHSKLSEGEKCQFWKKIHDNEIKLVIGSRSSIFAPFQNLGMIIVDEEHELSYKQDNAPRYEIHKVIEKMQELQPQIKTVYGSATPSIETAEKFQKSTLHLKERIGDSILPEIEIIDMRNEFHRKNFSIFSDRLQEEIAYTLNKKEQTILFLNRRGSASSIVCRDCGYKVQCENCEIPMTYHMKTFGSPSLICHHCGKISTPPLICPECKGPNIRFLGIGTQRIEADLLKMFPKAKVLRADKDTTATKHGFEKIYKDFREHKADILIGTQMIAKGLDLPKVNLVGVVLADIGLNIPDFRTNERNFQLMTQVAGRSGRSSQKGKVLIQTYSPDNFTLAYVQKYDYENFFKYEITQRKLLNQPPFSKLAKILIQNVSLQKCKEKTTKLENILNKLAQEIDKKNELEINSYPAYITRLRNKYQYIILLKDPSTKNLIHKTLEKIPKEYIIDTEVKIDIDPISIT